MTTPISDMLKSFSGMKLLPNGNLVPASFDISKVDEYALKEQNCQKLKAELMLELKRSSFTELKALFEERGADFLIEMFSADPWENVNNGAKSVLENALQEMKFNLPEETLVYFFNYIVDNLEEAKATNMNLLHVLARNCCSSFSEKVIALLKVAVEQNPQLLTDRMKLDEGFDMTPVEMAIRTSYDESLMNFMLSKYQKTVDLTSEDKSKLLSHAKWLSNSGIYSTALIGERLIKKIETL